MEKNEAETDSFGDATNWRGGRQADVLADAYRDSRIAPVSDDEGRQPRRWR